jgi:hypothetical protein
MSNAKEYRSPSTRLAYRLVAYKVDIYEN